MRDHATPLLANSGPVATEVMRTVPLGRVLALRPKRALAWWMERRAPGYNGELPRRYDQLVLAASCSLFEALGIQQPTVNAPDLLLPALWSALRERGALPVLDGVVLRPGAVGATVEEGLSRVWAPLHPWTQRGAAAQARATAAALLFPAVVSGPLLLWRRRPRLSGVRIHDGFAVRLFRSTGGDDA
jgi:hypothetical protein